LAEHSQMFSPQAVGFN